MIIGTNPDPITRFVLSGDYVECGFVHPVIAALRLETMPIKSLVNGAVKRVELLNSLFRSSCLGFVAVNETLSMTLGRFLLFFAAGLVLAIAFPPLSWLIWPLAALAAVVVVRLIRR